MTGHNDPLPCFQSEADALARIIALAFEPQRALTDPPRSDVVRLIGEALQCAYEAGVAHSDTQA